MRRDPPNTPTRNLAFRGATIGALSVLLASSALAQTEVTGTPYLAFVEQNVTWEPLQNPTTAVTGTSYTSNFFSEVNLPFTYRFWDGDVSKVTIGPGLVVMEGGVGSASYWYYNSGYGTSDPDRYIAPFWDYTSYANSTDGALYEVLGRAPTRQFAIEWRNARHLVYGAFNFQVRLYEGLSGRMDIIYGAMTSAPSYNYGATMAVENGDGSSAILLAGSRCTTSCTYSDFTALTGTRITLLQDPGIELVSMAIDAPQFATLGVPFTAPITIANAHRNPIGPFDVRVYASTSRDGSNPVDLGTTSVALTAFQVAQPTIQLDPPVSLGENSYYLFVEVDSGGAITEVDETNNVIRSTSTVRFLPSRPDLRVDSVDLSQRSVVAGNTFNVVVNVTNAGSEAVTAATVDVMLSTNPVISANDNQLGSTTVDLAAGASASLTVPVSVDALTNSGSYYIGGLLDAADTIAEVSEANNGLASIHQLNVTGGSVNILTTTLPSARKGESYVALLRAAGGSGNFEWTVSAGMAPNNIGIVRLTGEFYGLPDTVGCSDFTVTVTDLADSTQTADQALTLCVVEPGTPLTVVTRDLPPAVVGQEYSFQLIGTGGDATATPSWSGIDLPTGFSVTTEGLLAGSPSTVADATPLMFGVQVSDGTSTATRALGLVVREDGNLQIDNTQPPAGQVGAEYTHTFMATGGQQPISWSYTGNLPTGLDLSPEGVLSGTPAEAGEFSVLVSARDSGSLLSAATDQNTFVIEIADDGELVITTTSLPAGQVGVGYNRTVAAIGGLPPYTWTLEGSLPEGLVSAESSSVYSSELSINGTPEETGTSSFLVTVTDGEGRSASRALVLTVTAAPVVSDVDDDSGCSAVSLRSTPAGNLASVVLLGAFGLVLGARRRRRD